MVAFLDCEIWVIFLLCVVIFCFSYPAHFNCKWHRFNLIQLQEKHLLGFITCRSQGWTSFRWGWIQDSDDVTGSLAVCLFSLASISDGLCSHGDKRDSCNTHIIFNTWDSRKNPGKSVIVPVWFTCTLLGGWPAEWNILIGRTWVACTCVHVCVCGGGGCTPPKSHGQGEVCF